MVNNESKTAISSLRRKILKKGKKNIKNLKENNHRNIPDKAKLHMDMSEKEKMYCRNKYRTGYLLLAESVTAFTEFGFDLSKQGF